MRPIDADALKQEILAILNENHSMSKKKVREVLNKIDEVPTLNETNGVYIDDKPKRYAFYFDGGGYYEVLLMNAKGYLDDSFCDDGDEDSVPRDYANAIIRDFIGNSGGKVYYYNLPYQNFNSILRKIRNKAEMGKLEDAPIKRLGKYLMDIVSNNEYLDIEEFKTNDKGDKPLKYVFFFKFLSFCHDYRCHYTILTYEKGKLIDRKDVEADKNSYQDKEMELQDEIIKALDWDENVYIYALPSISFLDEVNKLGDLEDKPLEQFYRYEREDFYH